MRNNNLKGGLFTKKALTPSEANISKTIEGFLNAKKIYNDRLNSGKLFIQSKHYRKRTKDYAESKRVVRLCKTGTPDRFFIVDGKIYFIETKIKDGKCSPDQLARHQEIRKSGAIVIVADSFDSFKQQFERDFYITYD